MERRVLLAVVLSIALIFLVQVLFPTAPPRPAPGGDTTTVVTDTARAGSDTGAAVGTPADTSARRTASEVAPDTAQGAVSAAPERPAFEADTIRVRTALAEYAFSTRGAALVSARLREFESYAEGDPKGSLVDLVPADEDFFTYGIAVGGDTVRVGDRQFTASATEIDLSEGHPSDSLTFTYPFPPDSSARFVVTYRFQNEGYLVKCRRPGGRPRGTRIRAARRRGYPAALQREERHRGSAPNSPW